MIINNKLALYLVERLLLLCTCGTLLLTSTCFGDYVAPNGMIVTSMVRVLAEPMNYNGKVIDVRGYFKRLHNSKWGMIYLTSEDADIGNESNGVLIDMPGESKYQSFNKCYVWVRGTYEMKSNNNQGIHGGTI